MNPRSHSQLVTVLASWPRSTLTPGLRGTKALRRHCLGWAGRATAQSLAQLSQQQWPGGPARRLSTLFSGQQPVLAWSQQLSMRECLDNIFLLLNIHFALKNKELLSQMIYMETILLLAGRSFFLLFLSRLIHTHTHTQYNVNQL